MSVKHLPKMLVHHYKQECFIIIVKNKAGPSFLHSVGSVWRSPKVSTQQHPAPSNEMFKIGFQHILCDNVRFVKTWSSEPDLKGLIETTRIRERARWSESCFLIGYPSASCPLGVPALALQVKVLFLAARNKSFIDQACWVKMGEYWPPSILRFYWRWRIKTQRRTWQ